MERLLTYCEFSKSLVGDLGKVNTIQDDPYQKLFFQENSAIKLAKLNIVEIVKYLLC